MLDGSQFHHHRRLSHLLSRGREVWDVLDDDVHRVDVGFGGSLFEGSNRWQYFSILHKILIVLKLIYGLKLTEILVKSIEMCCQSLIVNEEERGEEAQEGEPGQHRHGVRRQGVQSRQDAVHFVW